mgnify:CR=1 FL=1
MSDNSKTEDLKALAEMFLAKNVVGWHHFPHSTKQEIIESMIDFNSQANTLINKKS